MKFDYVKIRGTFQPVIPITLHRGGVSTTTDALVDSGATASIFHCDYAEDLGIDDLESGEQMPFHGIKGDPLIAYAHEVSIEVGGNQLGTIQLAFSDELSPESLNILGQRDFFALFPIKFTFSKHEINLHTSQQ